MKIIILGGDGFCGWPTALKLAKANHEILIIDNLSRRLIDEELSSKSLTKIKTIKERIDSANKYIGKIIFENIDISKNYLALKSLIKTFNPSAIVHFAEQRSAPYSMLNHNARSYTVDNNINSTHNLCSAIVDVNPKIHLVHLGTMGVYGYSEIFGKIPEGYLNVRINSTRRDSDILYPSNPGSIYHMTKCLDQLIFQFYSKNWKIPITDLHQGIVWGIETDETKIHPNLVNRFDYDGIYGTVLNRFISQASNGYPLTVYGTGGQTRAFIHISDTAKCIKLAIESKPGNCKGVRIFNQVSESRSVSEIANIIAKIYNVKIKHISNPRKELPENQLEVENKGLISLGFKPTLLNEGLINDIKYIADNTHESFNEDNVLTSPNW